MKIELHLRDSGSETGKFRSGYSRSLSGGNISYHSSHPEAETALLVRANSSQNSCAWLTDKPVLDHDGSLNFCLLVGIAACQGGPHAFWLYVEGEKIFRLSTCALGMPPASEWLGSEGSLIRYEHQLTDMCGDHFGLFWLSLPSRFYRDEGLCLELRAEDAGSEDWMMVFEYPFGDIPTLRLDPLLSYSGNEIMQELSFGLDSLTDSGKLQLIGPDSRCYQHNIKLGYNHFHLQIPRVREETELELLTLRNPQLIDHRVLLLKPVTPRTVYILPYSHNDIGYTEIQDKVAELQRRNITQALELIDQSRDYPFEAVAMWNLEVIWALEGWWDAADANQRERFTRAVEDGFIGLNALYANPLTGLCNLVEIGHHFDLANKLRELCGFEIKTATVTDIPGFVWSLLPALAQNGVKYFSIAPNAGDRTGFIYKGLGDKPFWWISPSGGERVLTWVKGASYSQFHKEKITGNGIRKLMQYLRQLEQNAYPYEIVALPYTIGGDNGGPDPALADFVRNWNELYYSPKLRISTHQQVFEAFEAAYGESLPELCGDMTPYWEDGAMSTAAETVSVRRAADRLVAVESLGSLYKPEIFQPDELYHVWQQIVLWDEHTWGAWNSVSDPDLPFVRKQWEIKRGFALAADKLSRDLEQRLCGAQTDRLVLLNSFSLARKARVTIPASLIRGRRVYDQNGNILLQQRKGNDYELELDFRHGWEQLELRFGEERLREAPAINTHSTDYENQYFKLEFSPTSGAITRLYDKEHGLELLRQGMALAELFYVKDRQVNSPIHATGLKGITLEQGELFDLLDLAVELVGCRSVHLRYCFYHQAKRIAIELTLDKVPVRAKESLHLAFPFAFEAASLRYDSAGAPLLPEQDQLPGMCRNFLSPTGYADVSSPLCGVTVALLDAPLIEVGDLGGELPWREKLEQDTVFFAYLLNNIWHTNYKADQEGPLNFRFILDFHGEFRAETALQFSLSERSLPLIADHVLPHNVLADSAPPAPLVVLSVKAIGEGKALLWHILNSSDQPACWQINDLDVRRSDPRATQLEQLRGELLLTAYEQVFVLISAE